MAAEDPLSELARYPLLDALRLHRSRRFGVGMAMDRGPMAHRSRQSPVRLTEEEEALLAFAACGITWHALGDLIYEQGMVLQNLGLMSQAMGLGGFPHWAAHPYGWLESLGFRTRNIPASRHLGMSRLLAALARLLGRDTPVTCAMGLELDGEPLLCPYCPPY